MDDLNRRLFETFHMFQKLRMSNLLPTGLSRNDFSTLMCIEYGKFNPHGADMTPQETDCAREKMSISKLAKVLHVTTPAVSRTLKGLEEKGFVLREIDKEDRRNIFVELTDAGKNILRTAEAEMNDFTDTVVHNMDREDMEKLIDYLQQFFYLAQIELDKRKEKKDL